MGGGRVYHGGEYRKIYDAYEQVSDQIKESGITMLDIEDKTAIAEFARTH